MPLTEVERDGFCEHLDSAIGEAQATLSPLFNSDDGIGVNDLPWAEQELLYEIMFKLGMVRSAIIHRNDAVEEVHRRWLDMQVMRRRAMQDR